MKKLSMLFLGLATLTLVTGCGGNGSEKTLVCTNKDDSDGMEIGQTISMTFKNDKMNRMKMDVNMKLTDDDAKEMWSTFTDAMDNQYKDSKKDGVSMKINKDDKKYEYTVTLDIDLAKAGKDALSDYGLGELDSDNGTLEDNKKEAESGGYTCKVK